MGPLGDLFLAIPRERVRGRILSLVADPRTGLGVVGLLALEDVMPSDDEGGRHAIR